MTMTKQSMYSPFGKMWYLADKDGFEDEYVIKSKVFDLLKIDLHIFNFDTPLGMIFDKFERLSNMEDDLFTYELEVIEDFYFPCIEQPHDNLTNDDLDVYEPRVCYDENEPIYVEAVILINKRLVRLTAITVEQWLDLKFGDHKKVNKEIMKEVVSTWLIRSYKKQFDEYMEIKNDWSNNMTIDWYTKNSLWLYWVRGDDEEVLTDDELSNLEEENLSDENEVTEIFRIETDIFHFETPLCKAFKEFNYIFEIDVDILTKDIPGFKKYDDYKDAWIYEWNREVLWVEEKPWLDYGTWKEPNDDINNMTYFQNYEWYDALEDGDLKDEALKEKAILEGLWGHENREGMNFCSWLIECFGNYHKLDYELMRKLEEHWWGKKEAEESSDDAWSNYSPNDENDAI
ncbi:hypothetical protein Tco_1056957 [Tanacetum coccineum]|uniref:Uncharacterized protein n=1 Tax=Tanacetum coccineum TaxID=301880 RepID=A0ABQ5H4P8_9ASTR